MTASDIRRLLKGKKTEKPELMDLSILDENVPSIFDDLLNNDSKRVFNLCFFVSDNRPNTIYPFNHSFIHLFIHVFVLKLVIHKLGI